MNSYTISPEDLNLCRKEHEVLVIDCRFSLQDPSEGEKLYGQSHIAGAHYLHLAHDLAAPPAAHGGRHPLPEANDLQKKLRAIGLNNDTLVVAYDDSRLAFSARLWWLLRYLGHDSVKVLDGGFRAWQQLGLPCNSDSPERQNGDFVAEPQPEWIVDINTVKTLPHTRGAVLVDSREKERFLGQKEPIDPIAGHINGAVNYPWQEVTDAQAKVLPPAQLAQRWGAVAEAEELVVYCGSGVTGCVNLLSLAIIGRADARLYPGSWSDWCSYLPGGQVDAS